MLVPLVGNIAEHLVAVQVALQNKMDLSLGIAVGSGLQIALFVTPALVLIGWAIGTPMTLVFNRYELMALDRRDIDRRADLGRWRIELAGGRPVDRALRRCSGLRFIFVPG